MIILTEEQKAILHCYKGGRYKVLGEIREGIDILKEEGEDPEMIEDMETLVLFLESCSNKTFFLMKDSALLDIESEGGENVIQGTDS